MNLKSKIILGTLLGAVLLTGCSDSNNLTFPPESSGTSGGNTTPVTVLAPVAANDSFSGLANAQVTETAANGVLENDTVNGASITAHTNPAHGTVVLNADGSLTYTPTTGFVGTDTFTYTLSNSAGSSTATVTITISGAAFFVSNQAAAGGDGSQALPFQTLAQAATAASGVTGATIFVFAGDGTSNGLNTPITLGTGQTLTAFAAASPPTLTGPVTLTENNTLSALNFVVVSGTAVNATGAANGTISDISVLNASNKAVALVNATGTWTISNSTFVNGQNGTIDGSADNGVLNWSVLGCSFTNSTFVSTVANTSGTASQNMTVNGCTFTNGHGSEILGVEGGPSARLVFTNNTVQGGGTALLGVEVDGEATCAFSSLIASNNVTACQTGGIQIAADGNSQGKVRFTSNQSLGNQQLGFDISTSGAGILAAVFNGNVSDIFGLTQAGGSFQVENLTDFASNNTGTISTIGDVQNAASGSLEIP